MNRRKLGNTGLDVPVICLGSMNWGQQNTELQAHEQLNYAVEERGIDFIDTAEIYPIPPDKSKQGRTESYIGSWLKKRGKRDDLIIATKIAASPIIGSRKTSSSARYDRQSIREAIEGSLKRLQTDYVDLYQIHWPERSTNFFGTRGYEHNENDRSTPIEETLEALKELVKEGKIRHIGVSNETPWGVHEYLRAAQDKSLPKIESIQNQYSMLNRTYEIGLAEMTIKENIGMLAYSTLNMGVLSGKYLDGAKPEGARFTIQNRNNERYNPGRAQLAVKKYVQIAKDNGLDPAQMAIAFAVSRKFVTTVIIGATNLKQLKSNIDAGEIELSDKILDEIEAVHLEFPDMTH